MLAMSQFNDCVCAIVHITPTPSVSLQHRQLDVPLQVLERLGGKLVSHVSKADPIHAEQLVSLLQPAILPCCTAHEDLVDEDGEVPVGRALAPHDAEAQPLLASVEHYDLNAGVWEEERAAITISNLSCQVTTIIWSIFVAKKISWVVEKQ